MTSGEDGWTTPEVSREKNRRMTNVMNSRIVV